MSGDAILLACALAAPLVLGRLALGFFRGRVAGRDSVPPTTLLAGNLLVLGVLVSALFLGSEIYFRFVHDTTDGDALTKASTRWFQRHWDTNNLGLRDDVDYSMKRDRRRRRISFFGDSFTAAHGVADVGDRFVNRIRRERPGWEVHAIAQMGTSTQTQQVALDTLIDRHYELDTVVLVYCFNDIDPFIPELEGVFRELIRAPPWPLAPLVEHSYFANAVFYYWKVTNSASAAAGADYFTLVEKAYLGPAWATEKRLLRDFQRTVESHGGRLLVVTFPMLLRLGRGEDEDHVMHPKLDAFWRAQGVPHLDLLPLLREHKGRQLVVSRFDDHPSAFAHGLAAEAILSFLEAHPGPRDETRGSAAP
jgi:hypothetical protein